MANFRDRYDPLRIFLKRLGTLALLVLVVAAALGVWNVYLKERESRTLREQAEHQKADLAQQSARLQDETSRLKTDRGKEAVLRQQYDVGAQGERMIVIVDPPTPKPIQATTTFMQKLKKAFIWW